LLDAQNHPERHLNLIIKICGFSARFVSLNAAWQAEVLQRHQYK
jgi:pyruvate-formate lyase